MMRLFVLVEGQTEEVFVKNLLAPHLIALAPMGRLDVRPIIVMTSRDARGRKRRGGGNWGKWLADLRRLTDEQDGRFTTMFDLYGLPNDFPELAACAAIADTNRRVVALENAMAAAVGDWRLTPYIQRHEFEALVLSCPDSLEKLMEGEALAGLERLRADIGGKSPEDVNDGHDTAPSKRLERFIPGYSKVLHGPLALEDAGLAALRRACPRFDAWVVRLEEIATTAPRS